MLEILSARPVTRSTSRETPDTLFITGAQRSALSPEVRPPQQTDHNGNERRDDQELAMARAYQPAAQEARQHQRHVRDGHDHQEKHEADSERQVPLGGLHLLDQEGRAGHGRQHDEPDLERFVEESRWVIERHCE